MQICNCQTVHKYHVNIVQQVVHSMERQIYIYKYNQIQYIQNTI